MSDTLGSAHSAVLHLPILTTFLAAFFCWQLFSRYRAKGGGKHLLWWGIGMATYGLGTLTEAWTTLFGWDPTVFRCWYIAGAFLGGYPLAQGSIYLLTRRRFADVSAIVVPAIIAIGSVFVFLSPLDLTQAETHRLSGRVLEWSWIRLLSPFLNLYSLVFLVGGAALSAWRFRSELELRPRYVGNILIAVGGLLPGIGGAMTRAGYVEVLYVTELVGLLLIFAGYRQCVRARPVSSPAALKPAAAMACLLALAWSPLLVVHPASARSEGGSAEATAEAGEETPRASFFATTTVTATGSEADSFEVATPVTVLPGERLLEQAADNAVVVLRDQPGVDVNGVGPNQARPVIRGQRGLRVLYLEDGLRMNNARRQTDFGEIPGLTDVDEIESLEVVRGPASVLYGSDAIGGVLNLLTKGAPFRDGQRLGGMVGLKLSTAGDQQRANGSFDGRLGDFAFRLGGSWREADPYEAPSGSFGRIRLADDTEVLDSGVKDDSLSLFLGYNFGENQSLALRHSRYGAEDTGFGLVDPALLGDNSGTTIRILYPEQRFDRTVLRYLGSALETALVDSVELQLYQQSNERQLANLIDINIGPLFPGAPDSRVFADTLNTSDLDTTGLRAELVKVMDRHLLTYGVEGYRDESVNTDRSVTTTTLRFPFPPFAVTSVTRDSVANAPNATNTSYGAFVQDEIAWGERFKLTLGARYQKVETEADPTPGWNITGLGFEDDALVGSLNMLYRVSDHLHLTGGYGTAFRAPNIIERLFNGPTPEGVGFQLLNADLRSEESGNIDLGVKYQRANAILELSLFRNDIEDGIAQYFLSPAEVAALPASVRAAIQASGARFVVQERNLEKLRYEGAELAVGYHSPRGFSLGGNYTYVDGERVDSTNPPTGDSFGDKLNLYARYSPTSSRFWVEYRLRRNGEEKANLDPNEPLPPVGERLPAFTVHSLSGGARLFELGGTEHGVGLVVDNLTDELYAEFSNATFFRPQPGRSFTATYRVGF